MIERDSVLGHRERRYRIERDTMGEMRVPWDALYRAQTARAVENFPISRMRFQRPFLRALGLIKAAAAQVNGRMGHLPQAKAAAIEAAANEVAEGRYDDAFVVDVFQTGSGTSTHVNANEVIGHLAGAHPNDEVNRGQSSDDVIPTALHVAAVETVRGQLLPVMRDLQGALEAKAREFDDVIKIGRTHLQDAVPMRLGQEFSRDTRGRWKRPGRAWRRHYRVCANWPSAALQSGRGSTLPKASRLRSLQN